MKFIVIFVSLFSLSLALSRVDPLVSTNVGLIRGLRDDNGYSKFLGVPYAVVGDNVFGTAQPHPGFNDTFEAYEGSICVQVGLSGEPTGTTECLTMNIHVPDEADSNNRVPVMVSIHGGAFVMGNANEGDPYPLLRNGVILITINYRLGIYGFMCLNIPEVPGNTGLKDQVLAMKWIKENIEAFGGDPNQITLFGGSAGGMSTNLHLYSTTETLFHRAIIQSGPANTYWMMVESDTTIPFRIATELGFNTTDIHEALTFLAETNAHTVAQTAFELLITNGGDANQPLTKPCVEQEFEGIEHFLTEHPMNMRVTKASTTPIIIGSNSIEVAFQYGNIDASFFDTYEFSDHFAFGFDMSNNLTEALETVKHFYIGDEDMSDKFRWEMIDFGCDFIFTHPTQRMAQQLVVSGAVNVYRYLFSYNGNDEDKIYTGATHGDELNYLHSMTIGGREKNAEEQLLSDRWTTLWTNFVKYGDPTPTTTELLPIKWTPITATTQPFLQIDADLSLKNRPFHDRMAFWDLFYQEYGHYQKWYKA